VTSAPAELPLFPLRTVLFPDGLLELKVFEARYLDLIAACLRNSTGFGVVCLKQGSEVRRTDQEVEFESVGTRAELLNVDSAQTGILQVRCRGAERLRLGSSRQQDDGLWLAEWTPIEPDPLVAPPAQLEAVAQGLADAIAALESQGMRPFLPPHRLGDTGWVANRWCEMLPIPMPAKQKLMELTDPMLRLELVEDILRRKSAGS
jgi:Lon protease-like protein